ncbi:MAG: iron-sulfur cluster insertion protein ErpA [Magnetococcales bacterium]|nr:iron-sulfur cluster insertion protein ErpA [Magnetococcales bacterium]MBF0151928.1 iron-sulfur cluster insertion protein ErpA [Magnetococcales bacterium]MBF0172996.1 iron-sulfur cluster insertion protein ErpA [Magnetococcales bacterium]MBF0348965.1 iron-sulfur cluster insertion protein ErpA [Magnetococcales bacterium]MBF0631960.1 iron-sulfur cluster insertion protein ErpA [Magnetococcales bacterium]
MPLTLTQSATKKLGTLLADENNPNLKLRIFVSGGGCSGFQYGFTFDENQEDNDELIETDGVKVLVDPMSGNYLRGAEVDFVEDLNGSQFVIKNPNAASSCGCGKSFTPNSAGGCSNS